MHMGETPAFGRNYRLTAPYAPTSRPFQVVGDFGCLPGKFAAGGSGDVTTGWSKAGHGVAIKRLLRPTESIVHDHRKVMARIINVRRMTY